ncbi:hypothetical protein [Antrihabitans sp. YC2-6]|uniref:hypothetical protein n=1 Tax=Antrihabitans sp. YC2-6 TaxID=2799498 RepID=UPI0018F5CE55|nr:hypothetical protein [Antrihabitans sp. YC2-6]MBJ8347455.1 hypothetical protein [Antrihabitans sp. YC2-6]
MGESLRVVPADVLAFSGAVRGIEEETGPALRYLDEWLSLPGTAGGLFTDTARSVHDIRDRLKVNYEQLGRIADASSIELEKAAGMYRDTDLEVARELDRTYVGASQPDADGSVRSSVRTVTGAPSAVLAAPDALRPLLADMWNTIGSLQFLSPTWLVCKAWEAATGEDPMSWTERIAGNWEDIQQAGKALATLGDYNSELAAVILRTAADGTQTWQGNAATGASEYFAGFANAVAAQQDPLVEMGRNLEQLATAISEFGTLIGDIFQSVFDMAIIAAVQLSMSMAPVPTGPVFGAAFAATFARMVATAAPVVDWYGRVLLLVREALARGYALLGGAEFVSLPGLPTSSYDHPGV